MDPCSREVSLSQNWGSICRKTEFRHSLKIGEGLFESGKIDPVSKPRVMDGGYETSNVNGTAEMVRMIQAMRAFQTHVQVMK
ncbi:flagellar basal body rod protein, partial [mine drainage metagenome]